MKRRVPTLLLFVTLLLILAVPVALAYTSATGAVTDANGNPWTHGGTVECRQIGTGVVVGTGTVAPDGTWMVYLGSPPAVDCTVDPAPGPAGDPDPIVCHVPGDNGGGVQNYECEPLDTNTGPNAVGLSSFSGAAAPFGWALAPFAVIAAGAFAWLRRR
jgi:hypothetical protein